jgi:translocator protein
MSTLSVIKDITVYLGVIAFVTWQWVCVRQIKWRKVSWRPPGWVFQLAWTLIYAFLSTVWLLVIYTGDELAHPPEYFSAIFALLVTHLLLNKLWSYFASERNDGWAFATAVLMLLTCITILVFLGLVDLWLAFGLLMPNALWLLVALYFNGRFLRLGKTMVYGPGEPLRRRGVESL